MIGNIKTIHRPTSLQEAVQLVRRERAAVLGGGTHLLAGSVPAAESLVSLAGLGLTYVEADLERVRVGALTTLQQLTESQEMDDLTQGLAAPAARLVAARNLRGQATVGGMVAVGDPENPLLVLLLALGASLLVYAPEERTVSLDSFLSYREQVLGEGGIIAELILPRTFGATGVGMAHVGRTPRDRPIVCAAAFVALEENRCREVRRAVGGVAERPVSAPRAAQQLLGQEPTAERLAAAAEVTAEGLTPEGDFRASGEYRREMSIVLARRALTQAVRRTGA